MLIVGNRRQAAALGTALQYDKGGRREKYINSTTLVEEHEKNVSPPEYILQNLLFL